jgi:hypothetical protein
LDLFSGDTPESRLGHRLAPVAAAISVVIAAFALLVSVINIFYVQSRIDRREVVKWRADQLLTLCSKLITLSTERQSIYQEWIDAYEKDKATPDRYGKEALAKIYKMELIVAQIRLLSEATSEKADAIYQAHKAAEERVAIEPDIDAFDQLDVLYTLALDRKKLDTMHRSLTNQFRILTGVDGL